MCCYEIAYWIAYWIPMYWIAYTFFNQPFLGELAACCPALLILKGNMTCASLKEYDMRNMTCAP